jgi:glucokinase
LSERLALGLDLGGTKILALAVDHLGTIHARQERATPIGDTNTLLTAMSDLVMALCDDCQKKQLGALAGLGVGAPGPLNPAEGLVYTMPNLPGIENFPLAKELESLVGLPTRLENDANAALLGELRFGAAKGCQDAVMLTIGTGVGGAIYGNGQILHGFKGSAGELGHITVEWDDPRRCGCGRMGCLESVASGHSVSILVKESTMDAHDSRGFLSLLEVQDASAMDLLYRVKRALLRACSILVNALNPQSIVIGGGFGTALFDFFGESLKNEMASHCFEIAHRHLQIRPAELGNLAGAMGAASLFLGQ